MRRRTFVQAAMGATLMASCRQADVAGGGASSAPRASKPNIVLVVADDLGYAHLGCYGQQIIRTPNIDRLAAEGLRFTDAYAGCCVCAPSRSSLMTGQHTGHTPVRTNGGGAPLPAGATTMAEVLKHAGYATGIFGKWGLGGAGTEGVPTRQGFDEFLGPLHQIHAQYYYPDHLWKNDERFPLPGNENGKQEQYAPDVMHSAALDFIRRHKNEPFFLYLPSIIPHHEFQSPARTQEPYRDRFEETPFIREDRGFVPQLRPAEHFAGMVARLDEQVGEVMETLREEGIDGRTIVIFTSDNGPVGDVPAITNAFRGAGALRGYKSSLNEGGIRIPFIAHGPALIPEGATTDLPCAFWDLLPTFAELAGAALPETQRVDGISIAPTMLAKDKSERTQKRHEFLYWETGSRERLRQAVRMGDWKALRAGLSGSLELYDLRKDPGEQKDVAGEKPEVVARITKYLSNCRSDPPALIEPGWDRIGA